MGGWQFTALKNLGTHTNSNSDYNKPPNLPLMLCACEMPTLVSLWGSTQSRFQQLQTARNVAIIYPLTHAGAHTSLAAYHRCGEAPYRVRGQMLAPATLISDAAVRIRQGRPGSHRCAGQPSSLRRPIAGPCAGSNHMSSFSVTSIRTRTLSSLPRPHSSLM
jgi:hypothetical protein